MELDPEVGTPQNDELEVLVLLSKSMKKSTGIYQSLIL